MAPRPACNKTLERCRELDNVINWRGWRRIEPDYSYSASFPIESPVNALALDMVAVEIEGAAISGWRPIETAPKDFTRILTIDGEQWVSIARWHVDDGNAGEEGWWTDGEAPIEPLRWMPLPASTSQGDECDRLRAAMETRSMADWQSIDTAPKDVRAIVCGGIRNCVDGYHDVQSAWIDRYGNVWADDRKEGSAPIKPTHWVPVPEPPTDAAVMP